MSHGMETVFLVLRKWLKGARAARALDVFDGVGNGDGAGVGSKQVPWVLGAVAAAAWQKLGARIPCWGSGHRSEASIANPSLLYVGSNNLFCHLVWHSPHIIPCDLFRAD